MTTGHFKPTKTLLGLLVQAQLVSTLSTNNLAAILDLTKQVNDKRKANSATKSKMIPRVNWTAHMQPLNLSEFFSATAVSLSIYQILSQALELQKFFSPSQPLHPDFRPKASKMFCIGMWYN